MRGGGRRRRGRWGVRWKQEEVEGGGGGKGREVERGREKEEGMLLYIQVHLYMCRPPALYFESYTIYPFPHCWPCIC